MQNLGRPRSLPDMLSAGRILSCTEISQDEKMWLVGRIRGERKNPSHSGTGLFNVDGQAKVFCLPLCQTPEG